MSNQNRSPEFWKKFNAMETAYEWVLEEMDENGEDIKELWFYDTLAELREDGEIGETVLYRNRGSEAEGLQDRQLAYVIDGVLPEEFDGGAKVPKRFHKEVNDGIKYPPLDADAGL
jgi:hypothetical protein